MTDTLSKVAGQTLYTALDTARCKAVIGGKETAYFAPSVNFSYEFESGAEKLFFNICDDPDQVDTKFCTETATTDKVSVKTGEIESSFELKDGRLKINRTFDKKPAVAPRYKIAQSKGITWHYQPELTQEEIDEGCQRPDEVVGSYAIYCDRANHIKGSTGKTIVNYATGKLCHLYAPYWIDAKGSKVKGAQEYKDGWLTFALPDTKWLDSAVYPVTLDPYIGVENYGASSFGLAAENIIRASGSGTASEDGTVTSIDIYCSGAASTVDIKVGIYADSSGPNSKIGTETQHNDIGTISLGWKQFSHENSITNGTKYWPAFAYNNANTLTCYYDSGSARYFDTHNWADAWPATFTKDSTFNAIYSMRITYTTGGAGVTVSASAGAIAVSGYDATVTAGTTISATLGTVAVAGLAPAVSVGTTFAATLGTVAVAGYNPSVSQTITVSASSGSIAVAGLNPAISVGTTIGATAGTVAVAGYNPEVSNENAITATLGTVAIAGYNPSISTGVTFSATAGAVAVAGYAADVSNALTIDATAGSVTVAGYAAEVLAGTSIAATLGQIGVAGYNPSVSTGVTFTAGAGTVAVAGYNPDVSAGILIDSTTGAVVVTGYNPEIEAVFEGIGISCTLGTVVVAGYKSMVALTPAARINTIAAENRTNTIAVENRTNTITA